MNNIPKNLTKSIFLELCRYQSFRDYVSTRVSLPDDISLELYRNPAAWRVPPLARGNFNQDGDKVNRLLRRGKLIKYLQSNIDFFYEVICDFIQINPVFIGVSNAIKKMAVEYTVGQLYNPRFAKRTSVQLQHDIIGVVSAAMRYIKVSPGTFTQFVEYFNAHLLPKAITQRCKHLNFDFIFKENTTDEEKKTAALEYIAREAIAALEAEDLGMELSLVTALKSVINNKMVDDTLKNFFDRVVIINLDKRTDRWEAVQNKLAAIKWPFKEPERFSAYDGTEMPVPIGWKDGAGTWGCLLSHREVIGRAIKDKLGNVLILEDDIFFVDNFENLVAQFIAEIPENWGQIMLGGQFFDGSKAKDVTDNVRQVSLCHRAHAYAVRGDFMKYMYTKLNSTYGHVDHIMNTFQDRYKVYAPMQFLIGQDGSKSDISGREKSPDLIRNAPEPGVPIFLIKPVPSLIEEVINAKATLPLYTGVSGRINPDGLDERLNIILHGIKFHEMLSTEPTKKAALAQIHNWMMQGLWYARSLYPSKYLTIITREGFEDCFVEAGYPSLNIVKIDSLEQLAAAIAKEQKSTPEVLETQFAN
jgi:hypothetical protein